MMTKQSDPLLYYCQIYVLSDRLGEMLDAVAAPYLTHFKFLAQII